MSHEQPTCDRHHSSCPVGSPLSAVGDSFDIGARGRNTGQVIGVFGDVILKRDVGLSGYTSSINVESLVRMEALVAKIPVTVLATGFMSRTGG